MTIKVLEDEETIRFYFLLLFNLDIRVLNAEDHYDTEKKIQKEVFREIMYDFTNILTEVPSTVNEIIQVDAFITRTKKSFLIEFKAPYIYRRMKNIQPIIVAEMKWHQISYMKGITELGSEILHADLGYYLIPYPQIKLDSNKTWKELLNLRGQDVMGIRSHDKTIFENSIRICNVSFMRLARNCKHRPRCHRPRGEKRRRENTIWDITPIDRHRYEFLYDVNTSIGQREITPVDPPRVQRRKNPCDQLKIKIGNISTYEKFFQDVNDLPNPGSKFTPLILYLLNKFISTRGDKKELLFEYQKIKEYFNEKFQDSQIKWVEFEELAQRLVKICPDPMYLKDLENWLNSIVLIGIKN